MSLTNKFKLSSIALASAVAMGAMTVPSVASAEVSYNAEVASMNLFRGTNGGAGVISGGADYKNDSGLYAGLWTINTNAQYELDLYAGYAGEVAGFGYDISYWDIDVPEANAKTTKEIALGLSYADFSIGFVDGKYGDAELKYTYTTLGYSMDKFSVLYGMYDEKVASSDYSHVDLSYAATDAVSFTISKASRGSGNTATNEEMLFKIGYSLPIGK